MNVPESSWLNALAHVLSIHQTNEAVLCNDNVNVICPQHFSAEHMCHIKANFCFVYLCVCEPEGGSQWVSYLVHENQGV